MIRSIGILSVMAVVICSQNVSQGDDVSWPQFRGAESSGVVHMDLPIQFAPGTNQRWEMEIPPGHSSPVVHGNKIFLTTYDRQAPSVGVLCIDRIKARLLWRRDTPVQQLEKGHPSFDPASSTACCDDDSVVAYFGSHGILCYDHQGNKQWEKTFPVATSFGGNAASPILHGDSVVLYRGTYTDHFLLCLDRKTGDEKWRVEQSEKFTGEMACTACPIVVGEKLICHTARSVQCYDVNTGEQIWIAKCATTATSTPVLARDERGSPSEVLVAAWNKLGEPDLRPPFPSFDELLQQHDANDNQRIERNEFPRLWIFHRPEGIEAAMNGAPVGWKHANKNGDASIEREEWSRTVKGLEKFRSGYETHGLIAIPIDSEGFVSAENVRTLITDGIPEVPSPIIHAGQCYLVKNGGLLTRIDIASGRRTARLRTRGRGTHYASPLVAGDHLYTFAGDGRVSVIDLTDEKLRIVAVNEMPDKVYATPAIAGNTLYLRTHQKLYAFANLE